MRRDTLAVLTSAVAFPLIALSYLWILFAARGVEMGSLAAIPGAAEVTALLAAGAAIWLGGDGSARGRLGRRAGIVAIGLVVGANLVGLAILR